LTKDNSKAIFSDDEEEFEKTLNESMNNLNEIKDKTKTG